MSARVLLVVDVQHDFADPKGSLYVPGGEHVAAAVPDLMADGGGYDAVVASRDWHNPLPDTNEGHFDQWPVHCVAGTWGAELAFATDHRMSIVNKGVGRADYSAFQGRGSITGLDMRTLLLGGQRLETVDIVGLATDHCVRATVLDALERLPGMRVRVLTRYCAGVDAAASAAALEEMAAAGAEVVR